MSRWPQPRSHRFLPSLPPVADKASEVLDLEAKLTKDATYQAVWNGPRAEACTSRSGRDMLVSSFTVGSPARIRRSVVGIARPSFTWVARSSCGATRAPMLRSQVPWWFS